MAREGGADFGAFGLVALDARFKGTGVDGFRWGTLGVQAVGLAVVVVGLQPEDAAAEGARGAGGLGVGTEGGVADHAAGSVVGGLALAGGQPVQALAHVVDLVDILQPYDVGFVADLVRVDQGTHEPASRFSSVSSPMPG